MRVRKLMNGPEPRRGASAAELTVILPLMLLIVLGCIDFGRFGYNYIALVNSAQAGAKYAAMTPYTSSGLSAWQTAIQQKARDEMYQQTGYTSNNLTTTTTVTVENSGLRRVRVVANYASFQTMVSWPGIPSSITMQSAVTIRSIR